jgi:nicotinamide-nucleotide amidase
VPDSSPDPDDLAARIAEVAQGHDRTVAVAESLTGGMVASALARAEGASTWFRGGVVAYSSEVKHDLLDVPPGPVVSPEAATAMAETVARLLGADAAVAVTGAGGPDPQDGQPPGTVWIAVLDTRATRAEPQLHRFDGSPADVCQASTVASLEALVRAIS